MKLGEMGRRGWSLPLKRLRLWAALLAVCLSLATWVVAFAPHGFYSGDAGVKFIQAHDLLAADFRSRALSPNDPAVDPSQHYARAGDSFQRRVAGQTQGVYSVVFTSLTAAALALFGFAATFLVPLMGGILTAVGAALLLRNLEASWYTCALAAAVIALATPVLFFSSQLFEHTLVTGLVCIALAWMWRTGTLSHPAAIAGGLALGAAAAMRPEVYCAIVAVGIALLLTGGTGRERLARLGVWSASVALVLVSYWLFNTWTADTWDPLVALNKTNEPSRASAFLMLWGEVPGARHLLWVSPVVLAVLLGLVSPARRGPWWYACAGATCAVTAALAFYAQHNSVARILTGIFTVTPIAILGLLTGPWGRERPIWIVAVAFLIQVLALEKSGTGGGLQFGARLLMPALALLLVLGARIVEDTARRFLPRKLPLMALGVSLVALGSVSGTGQWMGMIQATRVAAASESGVAHALAGPGTTVVTKLEWEAAILSPILLHGKSFIISRDADDTDLFRRIAATGTEGFVLVSSDNVEVRLAPRLLARTAANIAVRNNLQIQHVVFVSSP